MTTYLPRSAWTDTPARGDALVAGTMHGVAVHWPGASQPIGDPGRTGIARLLDGYRRHHVNVNGWTDIAYQVAIDQAGRVWELRGIHRRSAANGDNFVNLVYGALLLLVGPDEQPTTAMLDAVADWRHDHWLPPYPRAIEVLGHQDVRAAGTLCPGPRVQALIRDKVLGRRRATTSPPSPPPPQEDEMPSIITADDRPAAILWPGGYFVGTTSADELNNAKAQGAKTFHVTPQTWDELNRRSLAKATS